MVSSGNLAAIQTDESQSDKDLFITSYAINNAPVEGIVASVQPNYSCFCLLFILVHTLVNTFIHTHICERHFPVKKAMINGSYKLPIASAPTFASSPQNVYHCVENISLISVYISVQKCLS